MKHYSLSVPGAGAAAAGVLEGPVPAAPLPVVRRLGHLPPPHRPRRAALARRGGRGQGGPRDYFQVEHGTICTVQVTFSLFIKI